MDQRKREILSRKTKEELFSLTRKDFTKSECQEIIDETRLTKFDRDIANNRVIECMTFDEIADVLKVDSRTIASHWRDISIRLKTTLVMTFYNGDDLY